MSNCSHCNKKKISIIYFICKCNPLFKLCSKCRMPEDHCCTYDFKIDQRNKLEKENPLVIGDKMDKI